ncbi:hypothetical protein X946_431 [Burkholderia sp. ABCPW 111]|nr:hypothetical protein X946_431 [Burkholderia sp. ABCPW 111]
MRWPKQPDRLTLIGLFPFGGPSWRRHRRSGSIRASMAPVCMHMAASGRKAFRKRITRSERYTRSDGFGQAPEACAPAPRSRRRQGRHGAPVSPRLHRREPADARRSRRRVENGRVDRQDAPSRPVVKSSRRSVDLSICRSVDLSICRSVDLSICRSAGLPVCRSAGLPVSCRTRFPRSKSPSATARSMGSRQRLHMPLAGVARRRADRMPTLHHI